VLINDLLLLLLLLPVPVLPRLLLLVLLPALLSSVMSILYHWPTPNFVSAGTSVLLLLLLLLRRAPGGPNRPLRAGVGEALDAEAPVVAAAAVRTNRSTLIM
jgi:hypothetical protein